MNPLMAMMGGGAGGMPPGMPGAMGAAGGSPLGAMMSGGMQGGNVPLPSSGDMAQMLSQLQSPMGMAAGAAQMPPLNAQQQAILMAITNGGRNPLPVDQIGPIMQALATMGQQQGPQAMAPGQMPPQMPGAPAGPGGMAMGVGGPSMMPPMGGSAGAPGY